MATQPYAVIATISKTIINNDGSASTAQPGTVLNIVMWDGASKWTPPDGTEARADPSGTLTIGSMTTV
ncbi:MAG TPA: hypothetical protein VFG62_25920 [Rhodopila sp.]|nr:hypothetical protein [Rhodopila sp.]